MRRLRHPLGILFVLLAFLGVLRRASAEPTFPDVLDRINQVNSSLRTFIVEQDADVQVLWIFQFKVRATWYVARPLSYKVVIKDAPWFLRGLGSTFSDTTSPDELGTKYRAAAVRAIDERRLNLELGASAAPVNPPSVLLTVDTSRWVIEELVLRYGWGDVRASFQYEELAGYLVPTAIRISVPRLVIHADLAFSNYRFNVPLPPGIFEGAGRSHGD